MNKNPLAAVRATCHIPIFTFAWVYLKFSILSFGQSDALPHSFTCSNFTVNLGILKRILTSPISIILLFSSPFSGMFLAFALLGRLHELTKHIHSKSLFFLEYYHLSITYCIFGAFLGNWNSSIKRTDKHLFPPKTYILLNWL